MLVRRVGERKLYIRVITFAAGLRAAFRRFRRGSRRFGKTGKLQASADRTSDFHRHPHTVHMATKRPGGMVGTAQERPLNLNPQLDGVECVVFGVQGKAQRRGMVRPRRAEQCLPQEGATQQRDAGAMKRGRGIPALPDLRSAGPLVRRSKAPHSKEVQRCHVPQKPCNPPCSGLIRKVRIK